ncbi:glutathione S-transferase family protein [Colwelliaceae bacterium 6441]
MKLLGSTTSPFVRRLRVYLADKDYQFINLDIFAEQDRKLLTDNNPTQKIPALLDDDQCIYDSRVIYRYLAEKFGEQKLSWANENILTLIDSVNDSLVSLLVLQRSNIDTNQDALFFNLQHERVETVLKVLNDEVEKKSFEQWHYPSICLWCLLDWIEFRALAAWRHHPNLIEFYEKFQPLAILKNTDPR